MNGRAKRRVSEMVIKPAKNGGHIVTHRYDNMGAGESYQPPEDHAFGDQASMLAHVKKHTSGANDGDGDEYGGASRGAGTVRKNAGTPAGMGKVAGVAGKAHAPAPSQRTRGAGAD